MARATNNGWDFIKKGMILQYKEDFLILIVEVLEDTSDETKYEFTIKPIAGYLKGMDKPFTVMHSKEFQGMYSGMSQFYENAEYTLPLGKNWPFIYDEAKLRDSKFAVKPQE